MDYPDGNVKAFTDSETAPSRAVLVATIPAVAFTDYHPGYRSGWEKNRH